MVSPLSGKPLNDIAEKAKVATKGDVGAALTKASNVSVADHAEAVETLNERLGKVVESRPRKPVRTATASEKPEPKGRKLAEKPAAKAAAKADGKPASKAAKVTAAKQADKALSPAEKAKAKKDKAAATPRVAKRKEAKADL